MINNEALSQGRTVLRFETPFETPDETSIARKSGSLRFETGLVDAVGNPLARCLSDQISAGQIQIARALAREASIDENEVSWGLFECDLSELSKSAAGSLIAYLQTSGLGAESQVRLAG